MSNPSKPNRPPAGADPLLTGRRQPAAARLQPGQPLPPPAAAAATGAPAPSAAAAAARARAASGARPTKRVKPARGTKMAAAAMSLVTTAGLAALFANTDVSSDSVILTAGTGPEAQTVATLPQTTTAATAPATTIAAAATAAPVVADPTTTAATATTAAPTTVAAAAGIADGTYVGGASQNRWGIVQVQVVYSGGQITDVQILQYPDGEQKSVRINERALPTLISESISAQSANVDGVSGATYTSRSYVASLQSAIDNAKASSGVTG